MDPFCFNFIDLTLCHLNSLIEDEKWKSCECAVETIHELLNRYLTICCTSESYNLFLNRIKKLFGLFQPLDYEPLKELAMKCIRELVNQDPSYQLELEQEEILHFLRKICCWTENFKAIEFPVIASADNKN